MTINWSSHNKLAALAAQYKMGQILISDAAKEAKISPIEFMEYLSATGFVSDYSLQDFEEAQRSLDEFLDYKPPGRKATPCARR